MINILKIPATIQENLQRSNKRKICLFEIGNHPWRSVSNR